MGCTRVKIKKITVTITKAIIYAQNIVYCLVIYQQWQDIVRIQLPIINYLVNGVRERFLAETSHKLHLISVFRLPSKFYSFMYHVLPPITLRRSLILLPTTALRKDLKFQPHKMHYILILLYRFIRVLPYSSPCCLLLQVWQLYPCLTFLFSIRYNSVYAHIHVCTYLHVGNTIAMYRMKRNILTFWAI